MKTKRLQSRLILFLTLLAVLSVNGIGQAAVRKGLEQNHSARQEYAYDTEVTFQGDLDAYQVMPGGTLKPIALNPDFENVMGSPYVVTSTPDGHFVFWGGDSDNLANSTAIIVSYYVTYWTAPLLAYHSRESRESTPRGKLTRIGVSYVYPITAFLYAGVQA